MTLLLILFIPLLAALCAAASAPLPDRWRNLILPLPAFVSFALLLGVAGPALLRGEVLSFRAPWVETLDLSFDLELTGIRWLLASLVTGIGGLILVYANGYMAGHAQANRLVVLLYLFLFAMVGVSLSNHLLVLFLFWELTSVSSYLLIGFNHQDAGSRRNALQALLVTGLGGMALLAGFLLIAAVADTWLLSELPAARDVVLAHPHYPWILGLVLLGAFTKSAQFPFHFWLPNAMSAPTPVSAYLHSATMVKAGVFLLFLLLPVLGNTPAWSVALCTAGGLTLILGTLPGLREHDLKKILAASTLAVLGLLTLLLGVGSTKAVLAAVLFLAAHAVYKAALFMVAGAIDHGTGSRDARVLRGLRRAMPYTAAAGVLAALSNMGLPPMLGFLAKEVTYKAGLAGASALPVTTVLLAGNALMVALAIRVGLLPFFGTVAKALPHNPHEAPWSMRAGPLLLAFIGLCFGLLPSMLDASVSTILSSVLGEQHQVHLHLWEGFNLPLGLSLATLALGVLLFVRQESLGRWLHRSPFPTPDRVYDAVLAGVTRVAAWQTRTLQSGYLRHYVFIMLGAVFLLVAEKLWRFGGWGPVSFAGVNVLDLTILVIMIGAVSFALITRSRLTAIISLGVLGFSIALLFAVYGAPDLAITQILIETLTVVFFAWVVHKLPILQTHSRKRVLALDALVALTVGLMVTVLVLKANHIENANHMAQQLSVWSYPEAHGRNIVNVILVDFRALDTLGEITVLSIASLGTLALLRKRRPHTEARDV